ncbi:MAG: threonine-phosphate decarboxylase CobD [Elainellaceae cyanobacterium]
MSNRQTSQNRPIHGGNLAWAAELADCPPSCILDFSASINPLGPPNTAIAAIQSHLDQLKSYPDPSYGHLRRALGTFHSVDPDWIMPGNGAAELLTWIGRDLSALKTTVLMQPGFSDYFRALNAFEAPLVTCSLDVETLFNQNCNQRAEAMSSPIARPTPSLRSLCASAEKLVQCNLSSVGLLINNPHNPTGQLWTAEAIADCCEQFGRVVVDEAFMDFLPSETQQSLIDRITDFSNLVILRSLTKFYSLPGLRIGYAIAHPDVLQRWRRWQDPWPVNVLAEVAAIAAVQDRAFQHQTLAWVNKARTQLFNGLAQLPQLQPYPGSANFLLVRSQVSVTQLQERLLKRYQVLIRDCLSFDILGDRYFRVAVRTEAENQVLIEGLAHCLKML